MFNFCFEKEKCEHYAIYKINNAVGKFAERVSFYLWRVVLFPSHVSGKL